MFFLAFSDPRCPVLSGQMDNKGAKEDSCCARVLCGYSLHLQLPQARLKSDPEQVERILEERETDCLNQSSQMETVQGVQKKNAVFGKPENTQLHHAAGWCQDD